MFDGINRQSGILAIAVVAGLSAWTPAAESALAQETDAVLRVDTQLVMLNVLARDEDGPVADLTAADFTIFDDGTPQELAVFEMISADGSGQDIASLPDGVVSNMRDWQGAGSTSATVILVDRLNTPTDDQIFMNDQLLEFVESFDRLERLAVYELSDSLRLIHDHSQDPTELVRRVAALEAEHSLSLASSDSISGFESSLETTGLDRRLEQFVDGVDLGNADFREFERQSADLFFESRVRSTLEALEEISYHLSGLPGRKNLVWLSGRFPFTFDPWGQSDLVDEVEQTTVEWMEETGVLLTRENIAIYPVDVRGPGVDNDAEFNGVIQTMADITGGRPFYGTNDLGEAIRQAVEDAEVVYTLGFYPTESDEAGTFRRLGIEVDRDGIELHHRPGYYWFGSPSDQTPARGLAEVLVGPLDATGVTLAGYAGLSPAGSGDYILLVMAKTEDLNLTEQDNSWTGAIDFVGYFQSGEDGGTSVFPAETIPIRLTREQYQEALRTGWFLLQREVSTEGQTGQLRIALRDRRTGAAGSLWVPVR